MYEPSPPPPPPTPELFIYSAAAVVVEEEVENLLHWFFTSYQLNLRIHCVCKFEIQIHCGPMSRSRAVCLSDWNHHLNMIRSQHFTNKHIALHMRFDETSKSLAHGLCCVYHHRAKCTRYKSHDSLSVDAPRHCGIPFSHTEHFTNTIWYQLRLKLLLLFQFYYKHSFSVLIVARYSVHTHTHDELKRAIQHHFRLFVFDLICECV